MVVSDSRCPARKEAVGTAGEREGGKGGGGLLLHNMAGSCPTPRFSHYASEEREDGRS